MHKTDNLDLDIIDLLTQDGRMSSAEIARQLKGVSERAVRYRINRLVKAGVIKICAVIDPQALGFAVIADVFIEVEPASIQDVASLLAKQEMVTYVACAIGEESISAQIIARDNQEIHNFITGFIGKLPGVHKSTSSVVPLILKDIYQWRIPAEMRNGLHEQDLLQE